MLDSFAEDELAHIGELAAQLRTLIDAAKKRGPAESGGGSVDRRGESIRAITFEDE